MYQIVMCIAQYANADVVKCGCDVVAASIEIVISKDCNQAVAAVKFRDLASNAR